MIKRLILRYRKMKIINKFFMIVVSLLMIIYVINFIIIEISFKVYDKIIINQSSQILEIYTNEVENQLNKMERITFEILSNRSNQNYFKRLKDDTYDYQRYNISNEISNRFLSLANSENYISSIGIIDNMDNEFSVGRYVRYLDQERKKEVLAIANEKNGQVAWIEPDQNDSCLIVARQINGLDDMKHLVTLIIRVDLDKLLRLKVVSENKYKVSIVIWRGNNSIYDAKNQLIDKKMIQDINSHRMNVVMLNGKKNIITYNESDYTKWTYVSILPYEDIFNEISRMKLVMISVEVGIFVAMIMLGFKFSRDITEPIVKLSNKMKRVESGDFYLSKTENEAGQECYDEVKLLDNEFEIMLNKIQNLIDENYVKQLIIKENEFNLLQSQINPHFLYNTLASINGLAKINHQEEIALMVKALSNLLRNGINTHVSVITLKEEMALLKDYILIQKVRFKDRLRIEMSLDPEVEKCEILKLTLQPIVENAINYGVESMIDGCDISVKITKESEDVLIVIEDNGPGIEEETLEKIRKEELESKNSGVGLKNIKERLRIYFGEAYGMTIENRDTGGTRVRIKIPSILRC